MRDTYWMRSTLEARSSLESDTQEKLIIIGPRHMHYGQAAWQRMVLPARVKLLQTQGMHVTGSLAYHNPLIEPEE